jgi:type I site-specific restriction-modification system R (restriction) subunit
MDFQLLYLELKNPFTGQTYEDAIVQYKKDRSPNELLFQFKKRAIVFFAVDTQEVYMTTRLSGNKTSFYHLIKAVMEEKEILTILMGLKRLIFGKRYFKKIV